MSDDIEPAAAPWRFSLRGTTADRAIVRRVVEAHRRMGLRISLNDAVLILIRRAATPDADSQEEAWCQIQRHWNDCPGGCDYDHISCPEGWRLRDQLHRVPPRDPNWRPRRPGTAAPARARDITPPAADITPPAAPAPADITPMMVDVTSRSRWRRYLGMRKAA